MKKILVTGGAGYIGSHTVVALLEAGMQPIVVDNFSNSRPWVLDRIETITGTKPTLHKGDCTDVAFIDSVFDTEGDIAGVIHFAAYKAVGESMSNPAKYYGNNLGSLTTLLQVMQTHGCQEFVFSSSATVYGDQDVNPIVETAVMKPAASVYGETKVLGEQKVATVVAKGGGLRAISLRYFNPIGAHPSGLLGELPLGSPSNLVPRMTQNAAGVLPDALCVFTGYDTPDGTGVRDYVHVVDLAEAHVKALQHLDEQQAGYYDVFNIGTGSGTSVKQLIETFEQETGQSVTFETTGPRPGDVTTCYASVEKISDEMGWQSSRSIADALRDTWRWQETKPETLA